jgi:hypothetical protein
MLHSLRQLLRDFQGDRRGNMALIAAFAMPVMVGALGLGAEVTSWYNGQRSLQSAADSAAIAAASNSSATYDDEAKAVAGQYGLHDGTNGVTVSVQDRQACPGAGGDNCFRVTVSKTQPLILAQVVGFAGDAELDGRPAKRLQASAMSIKANSPRDYCILALASSGETEGIRANGTPDADLTGCKIMSNTNSNCNGHGLKADYSDAHGSGDICGVKNTSYVPKVDDPYSSLRVNIPANPCLPANYSWIPGRRQPALAASNKLSGVENRTLIKICGDALLTGDTTISGGDTVMVIYGGQLNIDRYTLKTASGSKLTVIFAGPHFADRAHIPAGTGTFDIQAPKTGVWKGVAMYQDPQLTQLLDVEAAGNSPAWKITGLVYLPHAYVEFSGVVYKASNGESCFGLVVDHLRVNGTGKILAHGDCARAGLVLPALLLPGRGRLVS